MKITFWDKLVKNVTGSFPKKTQAVLDAESLRELRAFAAKVQAEAEAADLARKLEVAKSSAGVGKTASADTPKKKPVRKAALKAEARDGDGDGLVQDGTIHERPAPKKKTTPAKKKSKN
jgi:hypothetical protein